MEIGPHFSSQQAEVGGAKCKANEQETEKKEDRKHAHAKKEKKKKKIKAHTLVEDKPANVRLENKFFRGLSHVSTCSSPRYTHLKPGKSSLLSN